MSTLPLQFLISTVGDCWVNHQGLGSELIDGLREAGQVRVACRERLGSLLKYYYRRAA